jgi:hypothetical protein
MFEFDMHDAEFLAPSADVDRPRAPVRSLSLEMYAELGLLTVAESQAGRALRR